MTSAGSQFKPNNPQPGIWRLVPRPIRGMIWISIIVQSILSFVPQLLADTVKGAESTSSISFGTSTIQMPPPAPAVTVNRRLPRTEPPSGEFKFSANPGEDEICHARIFSKPIVAIGDTTSSENKDLARALLNVRGRSDQDDVSDIEHFLQSHTNSAYYISLMVNLAEHYRQTSQFSKALASWQQVWNAGKEKMDLNGRQLVDQAVGEWATFLVTLGRSEELKVLLQQLRGRDLQGAAAVEISDAREALWQMEQRPKKTFKCGPYSMLRIQHALNPSISTRAAFFDEESNTNGTSLYQNWLLGQKMGLKYQMARRQPGAEIPLPAMVHWKLGHYSALIKIQDGRYLIEDPTFNQGWVSLKVLDEETDGYFLIPDGPLPSGWSSVTKKEGETIFGQSAPTLGDPNFPTPIRINCHGMARYDVGQMRISLTLVDTPLSYAPPRGPAVEFEVTYAECSVNQSGPFSYSNLGNQWGFGWLQYISDNTNQPTANVGLVLNNGNMETFGGFNSTNNTYAIEEKSRGQLIKTSDSSYQCLYPDGSMEVYSQPDPAIGSRRVFLTKKLDPAGNGLTFVYDSNYRLANVVDAIGQVTTLYYGLTNDIYKITRVTDPFGRFATFQYDASGLLTNITDALGIFSTFTYGAPGEANFINSLITPYGMTGFTNNNASYTGRWLEVTDPVGAQERYEFTEGRGAPGIDPFDMVPNGLNANGYDNELYFRMSFFWDKRAMQAMKGELDYTKATQYVWTRSAGNMFSLSSTIESVKLPLESTRTWNNYPGQLNTDTEGTIAEPSLVARMLDDGSTQLTQFQRNSIGNPVRIIDPSKRTSLFTYATNQIDLLSMAQLADGTTNVLSLFTYNSQHLPLTAVDAAGQTNFFGYNAYGQLTALTNALGQTVTLSYDANGYLTNILGSLPGSTTSFTYDGYGRMRTTTDSQGYTMTTSYDAADRPTNIFYPDGTYQQIIYNYLDPVLTRDRNGHWTAMTYDPLQHLTDIYDNVGRHTQFSWCGCGSLESITDPMGSVTSWVRDLQGRVQSKVYPDMTTLNYTYETNTSRLKSITDAKSQITQYQYFIDNNLKQVSYSDAIVATPSVAYTYDTNYNRLLTMTDGIGITTYTYYQVTSGQLGAGKLAGVDGPFVNDTITYNYDALGRVSSRDINGVAQRATYDDLGRVIMVTNVLGSFTNTYVGTTAEISTNFYPNGQKTVFSYLSTTNDERLAEIWNQNPAGATISKFDYDYDPEGQVTNWMQQADEGTPMAYTYQYDAGRQLSSAVLNRTGVGATVMKQYAYGYDLAGNRTSEQIDNSISGAIFNNVNQLTSRTAGSGSMQFAGNVSKPAMVTIGGNPATLNHATTNFTGYVNVGVGTNVVSVIATDYNGNSTTNKYQLVVTNNGVARTISYDLNGNETSVITAASTNTYQWDAADRLVGITGPANQSRFVYDGLGRRVQIIESTNDVAYATNKFVRDGEVLAEQRDETGGTVTRRFFGEGEQISGVNYFFTRDHLGSVREMTDGTGAIRFRGDYDPYGRPNHIQGDLTPDSGYAGIYYHVPSGLNLTLYRAYDSDLGRWLSRDPIQEHGGLNLYNYVGNDSINYVDRSGCGRQNGLLQFIKMLLIKCFLNFQR